LALRVKSIQGAIADYLGYVDTRDRVRVDSAGILGYRHLKGHPHGDGTQRRSFTWVSDVVGAMLALIAHPRAHGEVFNIGHTKEISIYDLAVLVKQMTGSPSGIVLVPYEQAYEAGFEDMARRAPDISKIQGLIGYRPVLALAEMLERVIECERQCEK
jgi:UDP-glucose 4-epimerase